MRNTTRWAMALFMLLASTTSRAQLDLIDEEPDNRANEPAPVQPVPSPRQLKWNETEFYGFFHYGMNTFTGSEWGLGNENESTYNPTSTPDPKQWLTACQAAGMKGAIAVVKHHDGFCLWPTSTTDHSITHSTGTYAKTDIPKAFGQAAQELGMKYGFYVSPWDRSNSYYGTQDYIDKVFVPQCEELAQYGSDQFEMWFDGANGGDGYYGGSTKVTKSIDRYVYYDIPNLRWLIHSMAPNCVMWGVGGEARWIGNENGLGYETCWSTAPWEEDKANQYYKNQHGEEDYWLWNAAESDGKATSEGWFWHSGEKVSSAETLFKMYLETVGRNSTLILNFPPNRAGLLPDEDVSVMSQLGSMLATRLGNDLARSATVTATATRAEGVGRDYKAANVNDGEKDTYWATDDGTTAASLTFDLGSTRTLHYVLLQEYIKLGQRVQGFDVEYSTDNENWTSVSGITQTTIGYKRIIPLCGSTTNSYNRGVEARYVRVSITKSKACPTLHTVGIY